MLRILIVEDDVDLRQSLATALRRGGHAVLEAAGAAAAGPLLLEVDLLLTDLRLADGEGTALLAEARARSPRLQCIVMTGHGTIESAIAATRSGARDYLLKPFEMEDLKAKVREVDRLLSERREAESESLGLGGTSAAMQRVLTAVDVAAASSAPVFIEGETGTGKELVANAIHQRSPRRDRPLVAVNLAALPSELADSELFGHERGAFTSAGGSRKGRFALAAGGTLFLDEINSMPLSLQPKLLRALETGEIWPVGAERPLRVDLRVIAASNTRLQDRVAEGLFRADLYYRLAVLRVDVPPLRERAADIPLLAQALLRRSEVARAAPLPIEIDPDALLWLREQPWPGNVRELKNVLERAVLQPSVLSRLPPRLTRWDLSHAHTAPAPAPPARPPAPLPGAAVSFKEAQVQAMDSWTRVTIEEALRQSQGNRAQAAKRLQMNRTALFRLMRKLGIRG